MTTRRSFFKSLALLGAEAAGCPGIFIPKFGLVCWNPLRPQFERCKFTSFFIDAPLCFDDLIIESIQPTDGWLGHVQTAPWDEFLEI